MKDLIEFIEESLNANEALDASQYNKIKAMRVRQKKEDLLAVKKGLSKIDSDELIDLAGKAYDEIGQYEDPDKLFDAYDRGDLENVSKISDDIKAANANNDIDFDTLVDVIEIIASGKNVAQAVTILAKKI